MTSRRRRKKQAQSLGLLGAEVQLITLLEEVLDALRWTQVLGFGNQFLLNQHLQVDQAERDRVMRAAAASVEQDGRLQDWRQRLQELEQKLRTIDAGLRKEPAATTAAPPGTAPETAAEAEHEE